MLWSFYQEDYDSNPLCSGRKLVRRNPWPSYIVTNLVSSAHHDGQITISDLDIDSLVLTTSHRLMDHPQVRQNQPGGYGPPPHPRFTTDNYIEPFCFLPPCTGKVHSR